MERSAFATPATIVGSKSKRHALPHTRNSQLSVLAGRPGFRLEKRRVFELRTFDGFLRPASSFSLRKNNRRSTKSPIALQVFTAKQSVPKAEADVSVVWFRPGDLRIHDNPGLSKAQRTSKHIVPVFVFDERVGTPSRLLVESVSDLKESLRRLGSDLIVRTGKPEVVVADVACKVGASTVFAHRRLDHAELQVERSLADLLRDSQVQLDTWTSVLRKPTTTGTAVPETYDQYKARIALSLKAEDPTPAPNSLPPLPPNQSIESEEVPVEVTGHEEPVIAWLKGGESSALRELDDFLSNGEKKGRKAFQRYFSRMLENDLGCLSRRHVHTRALQTERERGYPFGFSLSTTRSAVEAIEWTDFHTNYAIQRLSASSDVRYWTWRGFLCNYVQAGSSGPAVLFIHGFGASVGHYRQNIAELAKDHRVFALDMLGFGRSEKPDLPRFISDSEAEESHCYGQDLWSANVAAFIREVIGEPVIIAGNSIGGYVSANIAADFKDLVKGVCLFNSAGPLFAPNEKPKEPSSTAPRQPSLFAKFPSLTNFIAWGIFQYLLRAIDSTLVRVYPNNPEALADGVLAKDIYRDALDPGAIGILAAGFTLPPPRSLNQLLHMYGGPVAVIQGGNDPLNNSRDRAKKLKSVYPSSTVHVIEAGHCPHDELPDEVNRLMRSWIASMPFNDSASPSPSVAAAAPV